jgi:hypothetical protein
MMMVLAIFTTKNLGSISKPQLGNKSSLFSARLVFLLENLIQEEVDAITRVLKLS